jgi:hypothetical protein
MKPGGPGFEALCGAQKPPDYPLLTTTTETSVNCENCKRIVSSDQKQVPPERIWMAADTPFDVLDTWEKKINESDIEYVRADMATRAVSTPDAISEVEKIAEEVNAAKEALARDATSETFALVTLDIPTILTVAQRLRSLSPEVGE